MWWSWGGFLEAAVTNDALLRERGVEAGAWQRETGLREGPYLPLKHRIKRSLLRWVVLMAAVGGDFCQNSAFCPADP